MYTPSSLRPSTNVYFTRLLQVRHWAVLTSSFTVLHAYDLYAIIHCMLFCVCHLLDAVVHLICLPQACVQRPTHLRRSVELRGGGCKQLTQEGLFLVSLLFKKP